MPGAAQLQLYAPAFDTEHSLHRRCAIEGIGRVAGSGIGIEDLEGCSLQGFEIRTERAVFSRSQYSALVQGQYYTFSSPSRRT